MIDHLETRCTLKVNGKSYDYFCLKTAAKNGLSGIERLPFSLKVLLENLLRHQDGKTVTTTDLKAMQTWLKKATSQHEIAYRPARVLMQDFTGVPAVVDLAAMRDAMAEMGEDPERINPLAPVDLVIDHSVQVDQFASANAFTNNVTMEMQRNQERYQFLRWGQSAFKHFRAVPPGTGICHQVNLEYLAKTVWEKTVDGRQMAYPDTLVGTDSHTTMINALGVLGWGVGGIEAEAAMLGQPISMLIPEVVGFELTGKLPEGITATDLVLRIVEMLRQHGVVGKFVEFFGVGLSELALADRATIANMAPEYGATCGFFPIDKETIHYLTLTGREPETVALVETYAKAQGLWHDENASPSIFTSTLTLDLSTIVPSLAGPKRPQDRVTLEQLMPTFDKLTAELDKKDALSQSFQVPNEPFKMHHGDVVIAAITSCTNTSNPSVLMAAGLVAKKAIEKGLIRKPWVKSSLAPGSKVVTEYLEKAGLQTYLDQLGFNLVGYGCTTCIGNSGPLPEPVTTTISENDLIVSAVLSGNRNFEGRVHPQVKANWLASPPLVVAFALAGTTRIDLSSAPLGKDQQGNLVYLKDIWPSNREVADAVCSVSNTMFQNAYEDVFQGDERWQNIKIPNSNTYQWQPDSTYVKHPPFFENMQATPAPIQSIKEAKILALLGDSITTDHISPAGSIKADSPAGIYLKEKGVDTNQFNSYGSRRGNHEVMMRGTFANIRIRNEMAPDTEGGFTTYLPTQTIMPIYDAAMRYQQDKTDLVVIAGKEYGTGSSRDWAAKGTRLLGVKAVIAESFERIHRSNLIGMGVLPLVFTQGQTRKTLQLNGSEVMTFLDLHDDLSPRQNLKLSIKRSNGKVETIDLQCRIDTANEVSYYRHGGILQYVLRQLITKK